MESPTHTDQRFAEREPLLRSQQEPFAGVIEDKPIRRLFLTFTTTDPRYRYVPLLGCLIVFINEAEYFLKQVSSMRAIEAMYCIEFYSIRDPDVAELGKHIPERLCKDDQIQKQLAKTAGLIMFFRMVAAVLGAIALGQLADRKGRKIVLVLHKVNVFISSALWLLICAAGLIGGNFDLGLAMLFASYTDVMPSASQRATLFFLTTSMQYVAQAVCPPVGGWLMNLDGKGGTPQIAMTVSVFTACLAAFVTIFLFPETLSQTQKDTADEIVQSSTDADGQSDLANSFRRKWYDVKLGVAGAGFGNILILAISIMCASVGIKATDWYGLVQYPVIKLGWTFPQVLYIIGQNSDSTTDWLWASSVLSIQAIFMLLNFGFLLPTYTRVGSTYFGSSAVASFAIMIGSSLVLCAGSVITGLSSISAVFILGMIIYTLGEGMTTAAQAYIASVIEKSYLARVMSLLSIAATLGKAIASGVFPYVLAIGLDTHIAELVRLPFFVAAGLYLIAGGCVVVVGLRFRWRQQDNRSS